MTMFWDEQRVDRLEEKVDRLEKKVDDGFAAMRGEFAAVRSESRADFRTLLGIILTMFATMIFGFAGLFAAILLQAG
jgi:tetrahydromethanopterin S-methyltransferase subunit B